MINTQCALIHTLPNLPTIEKIGKVSKVDVWVFQTQSPKNKDDCIPVVTSPLSKQRNDKNTITDEENSFFILMLNAKSWEGWISAAYLNE